MSAKLSEVYDAGGRLSRRSADESQVTDERQVGWKAPGREPHSPIAVLEHVRRFAERSHEPAIGLIEFFAHLTAEGVEEGGGRLLGLHRLIGRLLAQDRFETQGLAISVFSLCGGFGLDLANKISDLCPILFRREMRPAG